MTVWAWIIVLYFALAIGTFVPTFIAMIQGVKLHPGGPSFESSSFSDINKKRLNDHFLRMQGTLAFWKREATRNGRFHYYCLWWTIISSSLMPFLSQAVDSRDDASKWLLTAISAHVALVLAFHRGLKVAELYRSFRLGESEFYDAYRRLIDRPYTFGDNEDEQIRRYIEDVEIIRKLVRNAETDNQPSVEDMKTQSPRIEPKG